MDVAIVNETSWDIQLVFEWIQPLLWFSKGKLPFYHKDVKWTQHLGSSWVLISIIAHPKHRSAIWGAHKNVKSRLITQNNCDDVFALNNSHSQVL